MGGEKDKDTKEPKVKLQAATKETPEVSAAPVAPVAPVAPAAGKHVTAFVPADLLVKLEAQARLETVPVASLVRRALLAHLGGGEGGGAQAKAEGVVETLAQIEAKLHTMDGVVDRIFADCVRASDRLRAATSSDKP